MAAVAAGGLLLGTAAAAQDLPANAPKFVKSVKAPGLDVRYLDFKWDADAFDAMENGGSHPAAQRSWVLVRLTLQTESLKWEDSRRIPVGPALVILNPRKGKTPATLEIRHVDMRDIFVDMNVIAEPPPDVTYRVAPAAFARVSRVAPRLEAGLEQDGNAYLLTLHYGDRLATIRLTP
jgi:hypothetical protein